MIELLKEFPDVFAWSYQDMPGLDTNIVEHHLPLKPECPPVKQRLRRTHPEMAIKIKEEVQKQIDAGFLANDRISAMVGQDSAGSEERWKSQDVCRLQGFEQS